MEHNVSTRPARVENKTKTIASCVAAEAVTALTEGNEHAKKHDFFSFFFYINTYCYTFYSKP